MREERGEEREMEAPVGEVREAAAAARLGWLAGSHKEERCMAVRGGSA